MMKNSLTMFAALAAITGANLAYDGRREPKIISPSLLEVGDSLPELRLREVGCQVLVAFASSCPFCAAAAERERLGGTVVRTTWVASSEDGESASYRGRIHPDSDLLVSDAIFGMMKVEAVPLALVVDGMGAIEYVGAYSGDRSVGRCD